MTRFSAFVNFVPLLHFPFLLSHDFQAQLGAVGSHLSPSPHNHGNLPLQNGQVISMMIDDDMSGGVYLIVDTIYVCVTKVSGKGI